MEYDTGDTSLITGVFVTVRERFEFGFQTDVAHSRSWLPECRV